MKKIVTCLVLFLCLSYAALAQQDEQEKVEAGIRLLFTGMLKADSVLLRSAFTSSAVLQTVSENVSTGGVKVLEDNINDFITNVGKRKAGELEEVIEIQDLKIDTALASAWVPYSFYYNKKFVHCGVNSIQLVRIDGVWKIQQIIDTRRKDNCVNKL